MKINIIHPAKNAVSLQLIENRMVTAQSASGQQVSYIAELALFRFSYRTT